MKNVQCAVTLRCVADDIHSSHVHYPHVIHDACNALRMHFVHVNFIKAHTYPVAHAVISTQMLSAWLSLNMHFPHFNKKIVPGKRSPISHLRRHYHLFFTNKIYE